MISDTPISRRRFLADLLFLGGGVLASVAWAWASRAAVEKPPPATPSPTAGAAGGTPTVRPHPQEDDFLPVPGRMAVPPRPRRPVESQFKRTGGDVAY